MNNLHLDLTGKGVRVLIKKFKPEHHATIKDGFMCEAGFGCHPNTNGEKIFGYWIANKEEDAIGGRDVESLI